LAETTIRLRRLRRGGGMADVAGRSTLRLKHAPASAPALVSVLKWKCKPCGAPFDVSQSLDGEEAVRCPGCNARLGRAEQFRSDSVELHGVRARIAGRKA
jgi:predicted nucleic acid-binding Zn ribbon protein